MRIKRSELNSWMQILSSQNISTGLQEFSNRKYHDELIQGYKKVKKIFRDNRLYIGQCNRLGDLKTNLCRKQTILLKINRDPKIHFHTAFNL